MKILDLLFGQKPPKTAVPPPPAGQSPEYFRQLEVLVADLYEATGLERVETTTRVYQGSTLISDSGPVVKYRQRAKK